MNGTLYIVATPIGNLEDITLRALRVLKEVDLVAAEDTRHSRKLLEHFGIRATMIPLHEHNEAARSENLVEKLRQGLSIALISDAGTPCISDPGYRLVDACRDAGIEVAAIPGPSAVIAALSIGGLPTDRFAFAGFLPAKSKARCTELERLATYRETVVCYEAPHRLLATLRDMAAVFGAERRIAVGRELTKLHEEVVRGTVDQVLESFSGRERVRGELVMMIAPGEEPKRTESVEEVLKARLAEDDRPPKQVAKEVAREFGLSGSEVYQRYLEMKDELG